MRNISGSSEVVRRIVLAAVALMAFAAFGLLAGIPMEKGQSALAGVHSWVDEHGVMHFSDKPRKAAGPKAPKSESSESSGDAPAPSGAQPARPAESQAKTTLPAGKGPVFMWKVTTPTNFAYLLGSMHFVQPSTYPLDPRIEAAFDQCAALAVESDIEGKEAEVQALTLKLGMYPAGDSLEKHIKQRTIDLLKQKGFWNPLITQMKPWLLALQLQNQRFMMLGYDAESGIDRHFLLQARKEGKPVKELEDMGKTLRLLASVSEGREDEFLFYSINELERTDEVIPSINRYWKTGDARGMGDLIFREINRNPEFREFGRLLFDERNKAMAGKVVEYLKSGEPHFVVAGAGHLVGSSGIPRLLEQQGYDVEQVGAE